MASENVKSLVSSIFFNELSGWSLISYLSYILFVMQFFGLFFGMHHACVSREFLQYSFYLSVAYCL